MEALSVYHARPLDGYRQEQNLRASSASTEDLRKALIRYRTLFQDLVGLPAGKGHFLGRPGTAGTSGRTRKIAIMPQKTATPARTSKPTAATPR